MKKLITNWVISKKNQLTTCVIPMVEVPLAWRIISPGMSPALEAGSDGKTLLILISWSTGNEGTNEGTNDVNDDDDCDTNEDCDCDGIDGVDGEDWLVKLLLSLPLVSMPPTIDRPNPRMFLTSVTMKVLFSLEYFIISDTELRGGIGSSEKSCFLAIAEAKDWLPISWLLLKLVKVSWLDLVRHGVALRST